MRQFGLRSLLLAGTVAAGLCGISGSASAVVVGPPEFQLFESCGPGPGACNGTFTVVNNSSNLYVYRFAVENPSPVSADDTRGWNHTIGCFANPFNGSACGNNPHNDFEYSTSPNPSNLLSDIGPGESSDQFTFVGASGSPVIFGVVDANGNPSTITLSSTAAPTIPEPASLAVLGSGLLTLAGAWRLKRRRRG